MVREPEKKKKKHREEVRFAEEDFFRAYYKPICELFTEQGTRLHFHDKNAEISVAVPYFPDGKKDEEERMIHVGMARELLFCLMENDYKKLTADRKKLLEISCPEGAFMGSDGIYIR